MQTQFTPTPQMPPPGGFWVRALARIIDILVVNIINMTAILAVLFLARLWAFYSGISPSVVNAAANARPAGLFASLLGAIAYQTFFEGIYGSSIGKLLLRLHVFKTDGSPCTLWCAFVRSVAYLVDSLFFGAVAFLAMNSSPLRQRLGDRWAGSVVVRFPALERPATDWGKFLLALFWATASCAVLSTFPIWWKLIFGL